MVDYPINRLCPFAQREAAGVIGYVRAGDAIAVDLGYRQNALDLLGIGADDRFPLVVGPTGFAYAGWLPSAEFLGRIYGAAAESDTSTGTAAYRQFFLSFAEALLDEAALRFDRRPLRLLDYGSGHGEMLRLLNCADVLATGYEPMARGDCPGPETVFGDLSEVAEAGPYDLFVCTDVLEHLPDPRQALRFFRANATPGALLAVSVPNCSAEYIRTALAATAARRAFPSVLDPFAHLNHFNATTLRAMLSEEGFRVLRDYGKSRSAALAAGRFGGGTGRDLANVARVAKRALSAAPSTQLICGLA